MILNRNIYIAAGIWAVLWAVLAAYLPLFPVDETRYLTVAWEMRHSGDYLLPTLNFAPYSHKPPLLFWLINIIWSFSGLSFNTARIVPLVSSMATFFLTIVLARRMFPNRPKVSTFSGLIFMACPAFMIYGIMIMFDFMQAVCVMLAMIALWDAYTTKRFKSWLMLGLAMGLGVLAKGPVILVHVMPVALLFPFFMRNQWQGPEMKRWFGGIGVAIMIALLVGLAWAIPAAIHGGPKFTHMIFWEQSAGRMTKSFAHRQPFWFYVPIMMAFILPLLCWAPLLAQHETRGGGAARSGDHIPVVLDAPGVRYLLDDQRKAAALPDPDAARRSDHDRAVCRGAGYRPGQNLGYRRYPSGDCGIFCSLR